MWHEVKWSQGKHRAYSATRDRTPSKSKLTAMCTTALSTSTIRKQDTQTIELTMSSHGRVLDMLHRVNDLVDKLIRHTRYDPLRLRERAL